MLVGWLGALEYSVAPAPGRPGMGSLTMGTAIEP